MNGSKPELEPAIYVGAATAAIVSLLPYVNVFLITAYVIGALVAVWFAIRKRGQRLTYKDGAKLGFLSVFVGVVAAGIIFDIIWQVFEYQLWQKENAALMLGIFRRIVSPSTADTMSLAMAQNAEKPFAWYMFLVQLIAGAVFCGLFAVPSGLLGVKIFQGKSAA